MKDHVLFDELHISISECNNIIRLMARIRNQLSSKVLRRIIRYT